MVALRILAFLFFSIAQAQRNSIEEDCTQDACLNVVLPDYPSSMLPDYAVSVCVDYQKVLQTSFVTTTATSTSIFAVVTATECPTAYVASDVYTTTQVAPCEEPTALGVQTTVPYSYLGPCDYYQVSSACECIGYTPYTAVTTTTLTDVVWLDVVATEYAVPETSCSMFAPPPCETTATPTSVGTGVTIQPIGPTTPVGWNSTIPSTVTPTSPSSSSGEATFTSESPLWTPTTGSLTTGSQNATVTGTPLTGSTPWSNSTSTEWSDSRLPPTATIIKSTVSQNGTAFVTTITYPAVSTAPVWSNSTLTTNTLSTDVTVTTSIEVTRNGTLSTLTGTLIVPSTLPSNSTVVATIPPRLSTGVSTTGASASISPSPLSTGIWNSTSPLGPTPPFPKTTAPSSSTEGLPLVTSQNGTIITVTATTNTSTWATPIWNNSSVTATVTAPCSAWWCNLNSTTSFQPSSTEATVGCSGPGCGSNSTTASIPVSTTSVAPCNGYDCPQNTTTSPGGTPFGASSTISSSSCHGYGCGWNSSSTTGAYTTWTQTRSNITETFTEPLPSIIETSLTDTASTTREYITSTVTYGNVTTTFTIPSPTTDISLTDTTFSDTVITSPTATWIVGNSTTSSGYGTVTPSTTPWMTNSSTTGSPDFTSGTSNVTTPSIWPTSSWSTTGSPLSSNPTITTSIWSTSSLSTTGWPTPANLSSTESSPLGTSETSTPGSPIVTSANSSSPVSSPSWTTSGSSGYSDTTTPVITTAPEASSSGWGYGSNTTSTTFSPVGYGPVSQPGYTTLASEHKAAAQSSASAKASAFGSAIAAGGAPVMMAPDACIPSRFNTSGASGYQPDYAADYTGCAMNPNDGKQVFRLIERVTGKEIVNTEGKGITGLVKARPEYFTFEPSGDCGTFNVVHHGADDRITYLSVFGNGKQIGFEELASSRYREEFPYITAIWSIDCAGNMHTGELGGNEIAILAPDGETVRSFHTAVVPPRSQGRRTVRKKDMNRMQLIAVPVDALGSYLHDHP